MSSAQQQAILAFQLQAAQAQQTSQQASTQSTTHPSTQQVVDSSLGSTTASQSSHSGTTMQTSSSQPQFDLAKFWQSQMGEAHEFDSDFKNHPLPLARIKKVMKSDQDVKMISAEAPILFAKGCEIFIEELTQRAWIHAEENKRRTLQRSDIATAITKTDMCDFLIDIVPREEVPKPPMRSGVVGKREDGSDIYDQSPYATYYPLGTNAASYAQGQPLDPAAYYQMAQLAGSSLTPEQLLQYQNLQYAQTQQQQQQQQKQQQQSPTSPQQPQQQQQPQQPPPQQQQQQQSQPQSQSQPAVSTQAAQTGASTRATGNQQGR